MIAYLRAIRGNGARVEQDFSAAKKLFDSARDYHCAGVPDFPLLADLLNLYGSLLVDTGKIGEAATALRYALRLGAELESPFVGRAEAKLAEVKRLQGEYALSSALYTAALDKLACESDDLKASIALSGAHASIQAGFLQHARELLQVFSESRVSSERWRSQGTRIQGLIARDLGDLPRAEKLLSTAAQQLQASRQPLDLAMCLLDLATLQIRRGRADAVERLLTPGLQVLAELGLEDAALLVWSELQLSAGLSEEQVREIQERLTVSARSRVPVH